MRAGRAAVAYVAVDAFGGQQLVRQLNVRVGQHHGAAVLPGAECVGQGGFQAIRGRRPGAVTPSSCGACEALSRPSWRWPLAVAARMAQPAADGSAWAIKTSPWERTSAA